MFTYKTAGESHGKGILALVEGFPAGVKVDVERIDRELARRQGGYGRGGRQKIEQDRVEFLSGLRKGITLGSPIVMWIGNKDERIDKIPEKTVPRPGHADLAGGMKFGTKDVHNLAERSSARETAGRVAAGALAAQLLEPFETTTAGYVIEVGGIAAPPPANLTADKTLRLREKSDLYSLNPKKDAEIRELIDRTKRDGDTLGGIVEVTVFAPIPGLGNTMQWDDKLSGRLARALMSVQAIKGVEIGAGFELARIPGSKAHDEIVKKKGKVARTSNRAGGLEGGMTNGEPLVLRAAMKPIATLMKPLRSVDLKSGKPEKATVIRSDVCAVPAASVVCEAVVAFELARALLEKFGGDSWKELSPRVRSHLRRLL